MVSSLESRTSGPMGPRASPRSVLEGIRKISHSLLYAMTAGEVAEVGLSVGVEMLDAAGGFFAALTEGGDELETVRQVGVTARSSAGQAQRVPLAGSVPAALAARTETPVLIEARAEHLDRFPGLQIPAGALASWPVMVGPRLLGSLNYSFAQWRAFSVQDRALLGAIADHCALALERARLHDAERQAQARAALEANRTRRLQEITAELSGAFQESEIAEIVIRATTSAIGADSGAIWGMSADGATLEVLETYGFPEGAEMFHSIPLDAKVPIADAVLSRQAIWIDSRHEYTGRYPELAARTRSMNGGRALAFACLPLMAHGRILGGLAFIFLAPPRVDEGDRAFLSVLAQQCALGLERARLFEAERIARADAQTAARSREDVLGVVSHDLRNPLSAIIMGSASLARLEGDHAGTPRIRKKAEAINRAAQRMLRLIEDLGDLSAIQVGRLVLNRRALRPVELADAGLEMFGALAHESGIKLAFAIPQDLPAVDCDPERTIQVVANLLSNALKVTPPGGTITVGASASSSELVLSVSDTGPGIASEDLPHLFERYWRSKKADYKGTGLGLAIAKGIVDAHGGRLWAESRVGEGTCFCFALPMR